MSDFACLFVSEYNHSRTVRDIIMKSLRHHRVVEKEAKFENGYIEVGSCWFNCSFYRHNPTSSSRLQ